MNFWKGMLLLGTLGFFYLFAPEYFAVAVAAGVVIAVTAWFRTRDQVAGADAIETFDQICRLAGLRRHPFQKRVKFRRSSSVFNMSAFTVTHKSRPLDVGDLSSLTFRQVPLAFVVRSANATVKEAQLVENSRIAGVRFEYRLRPVELGGALEAASNMPDLLVNIFKAAAGPAVELFQLSGLRVQKIFFNGRVLHTHFVVTPEAWEGDMKRLMGLHEEFHLTLLGILNNVNFNVPL